MFAIAIDGPSGAGKSTLAQALAKKLGFLHVDTGAMYRTVALYILQCGIDPKDKAAVARKLSDIKFDVLFENGAQKMMLDGKDVSGLIRTSEVSSCASSVSSIAEVRAFLLDAQRNLAKKYNVIMDGRDIGTVILPDADVKFFMTASDEARAERRKADLSSAGENVTVSEVMAQMAERDRRDSTRAIAPAIPAKDSVPLDNSCPFEETLEKALAVIRERVK